MLIKTQQFVSMDLGSEIDKHLNAIADSSGEQQVLVRTFYTCIFLSIHNQNGPIKSNQDWDHAGIQG